MFFETSAKIAINVEEAFLSTAKLILENIDRNEYDLTNEVSELLKTLKEHRHQTWKRTTSVCSKRGR